MSQSSAAAESSSSPAAAADGGGEFMLFGFRVVVDSMRKSVSLNNLSDYQQSNTDNNVNKDDFVVAVAAGGDGCYASADDVVLQPNGSRERKRGIPWTEEEHKLFLLGLKKVGKGDWRGISKNFVKTRTPTQVASHAQKYFLRRNNHTRRRRRSSLFDITTESIAATSEKEEHDVSQENISLTQTFQPQLEAFNVGGFQVMTPYPVTATAVLPVPVENPMGRLTQGCAHGLHSSVSNKFVRPTSVHQTPEDSVKSDLNLNLNLAMDPPELSLQLSSPSNHSIFQAISNFNNGENIVSVA